MIAKLFRSRRAPSFKPTVPPGERVYAVGDVHGRLDLLDDLLAKIAADEAGRDRARTTLVLLGDLVDRGPESAGVVRRLREVAAGRSVRIVAGNHEEVFLAAVAGEDKALRLFCRIGGRETALSYGIDAQAFERADYAELAAMLAERVPAGDLAFLKELEDMAVIGDYAFVHAGVDPDKPLDGQSVKDLRWIRERFLGHRGGALEKMVVHGHTPSDEAEFRPHRIGIDTGAYASGRLTALGLEGDAQWLVQTGG